MNTAGALGLMEVIGEVAETKWLPNSELVVMGGTVLENGVPLGVAVVGGGPVMEVFRNADFGMKAMGSQRWSVSSRRHPHNQHVEPGLVCTPRPLESGEQPCLHLGALGSPFWGASLFSIPSCNDFAHFLHAQEVRQVEGILSRTCEFSSP